MKAQHIAIVALLAMATQAQAQSINLTSARADSTITILKMKALTTQQKRLTAEIEAADAKRNQKQEGVTPEAMERINDRQDSICLDLRSQLTTVELQIAELKKGKK